eukprot:8569907-Pyramimonas_sp.AAC.1
MKASYCYKRFLRIFEDHRNHLPVAAGALKSWGRMGFCGEGEPIPMEAMCVIIQTFFERGE